MVAKIEKIVECCLAFIMSVAKYARGRWRTLLYCVAILVAVLSIWLMLEGCSTKHYFSINAEEITNPRIEYKDSTNVYNPF